MHHLTKHICVLKLQHASMRRLLPFSLFLCLLRLLRLGSILTECVQECIRVHAHITKYARCAVFIPILAVFGVCVCT